MSPRPKRRPDATAGVAPIYRLRITLADVEPQVWRCIQVRGDLSLERLHPLVQKAMGWQDTHLHEWTVGSRRYGRPEPDEPEYDVEPESLLTLREAAPIEGRRFEYRYDLGDGWTHEVAVEKIAPPDASLRSPKCLDGGRACPPEDCGGPAGYKRFVEAIRNPRHPEHEELLAWAGGRFDPEAFDLSAVNRKLARMK